METHHISVPRRTRRSAEQWQAIFTEHRSRDESLAQLAERLGCKLSTVEMQLKRLSRSTENGIGQFVEVEAERKPGLETTTTTALTVQTTTGVVIIFARLPPPDYLAAALGLTP